MQHMSISYLDDGVYECDKAQHRSNTAEIKFIYISLYPFRSFSLSPLIIILLRSDIYSQKHPTSFYIQYILLSVYIYTSIMLSHVCKCIYFNLKAF